MRIKINEKIFEFLGGKEISILDGKIKIDGKNVQDLSAYKEKEIQITILGNCENLETTCGYISIQGNVNDIKTKSGNIIVESGNVLGNIETENGDIKLRSGSIFGNAISKNGKIKKNL